MSALLRALPTELVPERHGDRIRVTRDGESWAFRPIWVGEGLPADARRGVNEVAHQAVAHADEIPVITARRISPGAKEILEAAQVSWADASGRAHVVVPGRIYITRFEPARTAEGRTFKWSAAADAIAETLLTWRARQPDGDTIRIERLATVAEAAGVSPAHAARVLRQFDDQGYTVKTGPERGTSAAREFREPGRMLSDWAGHYSSGAGPGGAVEFHVPWREPEQSLSLLGELLAGRDWAVTSEAAADLIAPYLTSVPTIDLYVAAEEVSRVRDLLVRHSDVTEVESGGRIRIYSADPHVFRLTQEVSGVPTVSSVRVYADLLRHRGRSAEAGEHLREVAIGF